MKSRELRIGNAIIQYGEQTRAYALSAEIDGNIHVNGESHESCEPIPLNDEWLVKFGFNEYTGYSENGYEKRLNNVHKSEVISIWNNGDVYEFSVGDRQYDNDYILERELKYVHQLQNLYQSLTGEELTIL